MYGFLQTRIEGSERGQSYSFQIGYSKGTGPLFRGTIQELPGGTAGIVTQESTLHELTMKGACVIPCKD